MSDINQYARDKLARLENEGLLMPALWRAVIGTSGRVRYLHVLRSQ